MSKVEKISVALFCILMVVVGFGIAYYYCYFHGKNLTENAIEFCGCSDKNCVLLYVDGNFNKLEYNKRCK